MLFHQIQQTLTIWEISGKDAILNNYEGNHSSVRNTMTLVVKQYVYSSRCLHTKFSFIEAMSKILSYQKIENIINMENKTVITTIGIYLKIKEL